MSACSDDEPAGGGTSGSSGASGSSHGGSSSGKGGTPGTAGSQSPNGGNAGTSQAGSAGDGGTGGGGPDTGGAGADTGGAGADTGGAGADTGGAATGGAGADTAGGVGGAPAEGGAGAGGAGELSDCDYVAPETNTDLTTNIDVTTTLKTICASVDNGHFEPVEGLVDRDGFNIRVAGVGNILIRIEVPGAAALSEVYAYVQGRETKLANGRAAIRRNTSVDGTYLITVRSHANADIAEPLPYKITLVADDLDERCPANTAAATFTEASDGVDSRGNDVYQVSSGMLEFTAASDTAEATGVTVGAAPSSYRINGTSANIGKLGDYSDGDSYKFHTGPNTTQVTLRADWGGTDRDSDLFLFRAGEGSPVAVGLDFGFFGGEYVTAAVVPDSDYVVWTGLYEGSTPFEYAITACGEAFSLTGE